MISHYLPPYVACTLRVLATIVGLLAAWFGWKAANMWLDASRVDMPDYDTPVASVSDRPELHIMTTDARNFAMQAAFREGARLNAAAARITARAAILTAAAVLLGSL